MNDHREVQTSTRRFEARWPCAILLHHAARQVAGRRPAGNAQDKDRKGRQAQCPDAMRARPTGLYPDDTTIPRSTPQNPPCSAPWTPWKRIAACLPPPAALGVSQPALTKSLHELEDIIGARLFDRHSRGVRPTAAGDVFVQTARRLLTELRRLDDQLDHLASPGGGTVALGALPVAAAGVLPGTLTRLKATHPDIKVRLQEGRTARPAATARLGRDRPDRGASVRAGGVGSLPTEPLWTEPISILARAEHPIFTGPVTPEALRRYELVLPTVRPACRTGNRTSAGSPRPAADRLVALQLLRLHPRDAACHGPHLESCRD